MFCAVQRASRLSSYSLGLFLLAGCGPPAEEPEAAVAVTDELQSLPAPGSVPARSQPAEAPADPIDRIRARFAEIGADSLLVMRARVQALTASMRSFPEPLYWGRDPRTATTLSLEVLETICGPTMEAVRASYPGGRLPDGQFERTELMPRDPAVGSEHVFFLRRIEQEYFLDLGREDMLTRGENGALFDSARADVPLERLRGLCP